MSIPHKGIEGSNPSVSATPKPLILLVKKPLARDLYPLVYPDARHALDLSPERLAIPNQDTP